ncbi:hypothetical protein C7N43_37555 [Sphingobacteriales bacterium UPWRP_1]|nr:hypothetical protein B6N25_08320 [Sphingobacteriales bacterium TSM_CSS]PSJ71780.1 hypothetical protein C7N43_37555 [Sphingobacteriales bacterium UPWRP_1]
MLVTHAKGYTTPAIYVPDLKNLKKWHFLLVFVSQCHNIATPIWHIYLWLAVFARRIILKNIK